MARTRSIKADFWDDEKLATVSRDARLLFIGLWKCSDDYAVTRANPSWIKNQVFPYDDLSSADVKKWLKELEDLKFIIIFTHNNENFYYIKNFKKHQTVDRPSKTRNPQPPLEIIDKESRVNSDTFSTKSRESGDEVEVEVEVEVEEKLSRSKVEVEVGGVGGEKETIQKIVQIYHDTCCPPMPQVLKLTPTREKQLKARWKEKPSFDFWNSFFKQVSESHFLCGHSPPWGGRDKPFLADLEWVTNASNFVKICEGKYDNRSGESKHVTRKPSNPKYDEIV